MRLDIDVVDSLREMQALRLPWLELWRSCPNATPFQSPQWLLPWTKYLFGGGRILVLALRDGQRLVGLAPLFRWGVGLQTISFLGAGISDYGDLLFAPGQENECVRAVRRFLAQREVWDELDLQELRCGSGLLEGWPVMQCSVCPVLHLGAFPGSMDSKHRTDVRRARNRLLKKPDLRFTAATGETLAHHMDGFFHLHRERWGPLGDSMKQFHREAAHAFQESGNLRLSLLQTGGSPAAALYAFTSGKTLYCYLSGYAPEMAKLSPGAVLLEWVIEQAVAEGMEAVDFLRHNEAYKYLWGARDRSNFAVHLPKRDLSFPE
jgi:CelD/BcsL family acetyltransferase involved in cellulose biosynthesis